MLICSLFFFNLLRNKSGKSKVTRRKKRKEKDSEVEEDTDSDTEEEEDSKKATKLVHMLISLFISIHLTMLICSPGVYSHVFLQFTQEKIGEIK